MKNENTTTPDLAAADEHWHWQIFYYNAADSRVMVPKRSGLGLTVNFAQPMSYVVLSIPFICGAVIVLSVWLAKS